MEKELDDAVQSVPEDATPPDGPNVDETAVAQHVAVGAEPAANGDGRRAQFTSPSARRVARELGVDISTLSGSGPKGRVVNADDVLRRRPRPLQPRRPAAAQPAPAAQPVAAAAPAPAAAAAAPAAAVPEGWTAVPHSRIRKIIASRLQESKKTAPHFYLRLSARVDELLALRAQLNASGRVKVSVNDFIVKAAGQALRGRAGDERDVDRGRSAARTHRRCRGGGGEREGPDDSGAPGRGVAVALRAVGEDQGCGGAGRTRASSVADDLRAAR